MQDFRKILEQVKDTVAPSEQSIIVYVLENPLEAVSLNVTQLAEKVGTSSSAIVRLCKRLNIKGFAEFKLYLSKEVFGNQQSTNGDLLEQFEDSNLPLNQLIPQFIQLTGQGLNQLDLILNDKEVEKAINLLVEAKDVLILGIGASSIVAMDLLYKLSRAGKNAKFTQDSDLQIVQSYATTTDSVVFAVSYSGETESVLKAVKTAKHNNAHIITLSSIKNNRLSRMADVKLQVPACESEYRHGATLSRLNQLVVIDIIYSALIGKMTEREKEIMKNSRDYVVGKTKKIN